MSTGSLLCPNLTRSGESIPEKNHSVQLGGIDSRDVDVGLYVVLCHKDPPLGASVPPR